MMAISPPEEGEEDGIFVVVFVAVDFFSALRLGQKTMMSVDDSETKVARRMESFFLFYPAEGRYFFSFRSCFFCGLLIRASSDVSVYFPSKALTFHPYIYLLNHPENCFV
jgi:hypothetical protein